MKILLTGKMGVGKSTILKKAIKKYDIKNGIFTKKIGENVYAWLLDSNKKYIIGKRSDYGMQINKEGFDSLVEELKKIKIPEFFVIDEIGYLEEKHPLFLEELKRIINESKNFIGVVRLFFQERYPFLSSLKVIEINEENRNTLEL